MNQVPLKYSQNLITDKALIQNLVTLSNLNSSDLVLDIGTGKGVLAEVLAKKVKKVIAIEKDRKLFLEAKENLKAFENIQLLNEDFLRFNLPRGKYKVFANIPFSITAEIVTKLFDSQLPPESAYLFMQKEAALKFSGGAFGKESLMSVLYKPFYNIKVIYDFRKEDFYPIPSKDVCLIEFIKKEKFEIDPRQFWLYKDFVTFAINRWKPNIKLALKGTFSNLQLKIIAEHNNFSLDSKPTEIDYKTWVILFNEFNRIVPPYKRKHIRGSFIKLNLNQVNMRENNLKNLKNGRASNQRHKVEKTFRK